MNKIIVIIPAFNEQNSIEDIVKKLMITNDGMDIIVVDDCSTDATAEIIDGLARKYPQVHAVHLTFNLGIGGAVQTGYLYALRHGYEIAVQMDGDGQHRPEFLNDLVAPLERKEADMVVGSRYLRNEGFQSSFMRRVGIRWFHWLTRCLTGGRVYDMTSGYRAVSKNIIEMFARNYPVDYPEPETNERLLKLGYRVIEIPVVMDERQGGVSSIAFFSSGWYMVKVTLAILIDFFGSDTGG